jgi:methionine-rich copper-binding protein CopC
MRLVFIDMKLPPATLIFGGCALVFASFASAHAFLDHAAPAVGSAVHAPPARVRLWFTQRLEPAFSSLRVQDASGKRVDKGDVEVDAADATLLEVSLPQLAPGTYRVSWRVLSVDTHVTEGDFTFDVKP